MKKIVHAAVCLSFLFVFIANAAEPKPVPKEVEFFEAMENGQIEATIRTWSSLDARITIKNKTDVPLAVKLPKTFAGVPVLAQFGGGLGDWGRIANAAARNDDGGGGGGGAVRGGGGGGSDDCLALISNMKELQYLTFSDCYITELDLMQLTRLPKLKRLDLWQTEMPEELAYELENRGGFEVWDEERRKDKHERNKMMELAKSNDFIKTVMDVFQK